MQCISTLTGELSTCTIATGTVGGDGVLRGAIADTDLFAAFNVEIFDKYRPDGRPEEGANIVGELWEVRKHLVAREVHKETHHKRDISALVEFYSNPANELAERSYFPEPTETSDEEIFDNVPARITL